jgi:chemotaxis protein MotB
VLFAPGEARLGEDSSQALKAVAAVLKDDHHAIQVEGHTDTTPITTSMFPSNWELSAARAIAVVKFLNSQGIPNDHLVAAGYGEYQPLSLMDTARNRRIELKLTNR